jgi:putative transposase
VYGGSVDRSGFASRIGRVASCFFAASLGPEVLELTRPKTSAVNSVAIYKKYSGLALSELRELRQLREENGKLKRLVADLSLDRHILQEIVQKKL